MARLFLPRIRKILTMTEPHMALFVAPVGVGRIHLALDLLEQEYFHHFDFVVILCAIPVADPEWFPGFLEISQIFWYNDMFFP